MALETTKTLTSPLGFLPRPPIGEVYFTGGSMEEWKDVGGYDGDYLVSSFGKVLSKKNKKISLLKPGKNKRGYLQVVLWKDGIDKTLLVSRMVAAAFLIHPENMDYVNHINGVKSDNASSNLEWCSQKDNVRHAWATGLATPRKADKNTRAKLNWKEVKEIRKDHKANPKGYTRRLSVKYGVTATAIWAIVSNKTWQEECYFSEQKHTKEGGV